MAIEGAAWAAVLGERQNEGQNEGQDERQADGRSEAPTEGAQAITIEQLLHDHGGEIYGWLAATLASDADADDAFSLFSEELWKSLARYRGRCSPRTWCYLLARHAASRLAQARRSQRVTPLAEIPAGALVAEIRETTRLHLRTQVKDRIRALRAELDPDDQTLLILRVDRDLGWRDIAMIMLGLGGADASDAELARHAAALRKRFERVKRRLRELASGALDGESPSGLG